MPTPNAGETRQSFVNRCIPYLLKEGKHPNTSEGRKAAAGECYGIYDSSKREAMSNTEPFTYQNMNTTSEGFEETADEYMVKGVVLMKGDIFYQGDFVPWDVIKKASMNTSHTQIHDLNHQGTGYPMPNGQMVPSDISYIVGYQDNIRTDETNKSLLVDVHIQKDAPKAASWKAYYDICSKAGRMPNVSAFGYKRMTLIKARDLPVDYAAFGLKGHETLTSLTYMDVQAGSTVYRGACNDQDGCGMPIKCSEDEQNDLSEGDSPVDGHRLSYLKERIKQIGGNKQ